MSPESDPLDDLVNSFGRRRKPTKDQTPESPAGRRGRTKKGLSPLDLLALSDEGLGVIKWLARRKVASLDEIHEALGSELDDVQAVLEELVASGYVEEIEDEGETVYRTHYRGTVGRRTRRGMSEDIWTRLENEADDDKAA